MPLRIANLVVDAKQFRSVIHYGPIAASTQKVAAFDSNDLADSARPLHICLCTRFSPAVGGIETLADTLARQWTSVGHAVEIVTDVPLADGQAGSWPFPVHRNPSPGEFLKLARRTDVMMHQNISLKLLWPAAVARTTLIASHHSWYCTRCERDRRREQFKRWIARRYAANISCSREVRESLGCGGEVIPNPYDHERFRDLGLPRDRDLVFAGRLVSDKGVDVLIRALHRMGKQGIRPALTIVGDGPERLALEALIETLSLNSQVEFIGSRDHDELPAILNCHRIMVVPSLWDEPFGIVALEGAACGCVVVGSAGGGLPEAIGPCGVTFPNGDADGLAAVLADLLAHPHRLEAYRSAAPKHLAAHHADVIAARYIDVIQREVYKRKAGRQCA